MSQSGPKQYPKPAEAFKVGDIIRPLEGDTPYKVLKVGQYSDHIEVENLKTGASWSLSKLQFRPMPYEKDDGPLTDEQMAQIKAASSATNVLDENFKESLVDEVNQIDKTLTERGSRYGSFNDLAAISQALCDVMRATPGWKRLTPSQREALEMIQHKIARMLNGDPTYEDNAVDIVGYSTLMLKNMQGDLKI